MHVWKILEEWLQKLNGNTEDIVRGESRVGGKNWWKDGHHMALEEGKQQPVGERGFLKAFGPTWERYAQDSIIGLLNGQAHVQKWAGKRCGG